MLINEELESEHIAALKGLTSSTHCNGNKIAIISPVYNDNPSLIRLPILILISGTINEIPLLLTEFFEASV